MNNTMHPPPDDEAFSAWVDGELSSEQAQALGERWDTDAQARTAWHRYHWLGDALRSPDLARHGVAHDMAFVREWRVRRAADLQPSNIAPIRSTPAGASVPPQIKPHPLAHQTHPSEKTSFWGMAWAAAAAGVVVSGMFWVTQRGAPTDAAPMLVNAHPAQVRSLSNAPSRSEPQTATGWEARSAGAASSQVVIRDPRLDAYLFAHDPFSRLDRLPSATLAPSITRVQAASAGQ
jgi:sigma-E factor negative regulatory protein RseA